jgi:ribonuclease P protein component
VALPRRHRLGHHRAFSAVHRRGKRCRSCHLTVGVLPSGGGDSVPTQFGITVSQKVSKRAVVRNRVKRQISAAIQQLLPQIQPNYWVVIVVRPTAVECACGQFLQELKQLFTELEVIHGD